MGPVPPLHISVPRCSATPSGFDLAPRELGPALRSPAVMPRAGSPARRDLLCLSVSQPGSGLLLAGLWQQPPSGPRGREQGGNGTLGQILGRGLQAKDSWVEGLQWATRATPFVTLWLICNGEVMGSRQGFRLGWGRGSSQGFKVGGEGESCSHTSLSHFLPG